MMTEFNFFWVHCLFKEGCDVITMTISESLVLHSPKCVGELCFLCSHEIIETL